MNIAKVLRDLNVVITWQAKRTTRNEGDRTSSLKSRNAIARNEGDRA